MIKIFSLTSLLSFLLLNAAIDSTSLLAEQPQWLVSWTSHGFAESDLVALENHLESSVKSGEVPGGAILLMHQGEVIYREAFGFGHIRKKIPFEAGSSFRAASLSKAIVATLAMKLSEEEIIDLDEPIGETLVEANSLRLTSGELADRSPTIRECLNHTAGFRGDYSKKGVRPWLEMKHHGYTLAEVVEKEVAIPMTVNPGKR